MDQGPLVEREIDAGARFLAEFQQYAPLEAAIWVKDAEEGRWDLYVLSDRISDKNFDKAYDEVGKIAGRLHDPWFDQFRVKLIWGKKPLARAMRDVIRRYHGQATGRLPGRVFGGAGVEEAYAYPLPVEAPAQ